MPSERIDPPFDCEPDDIELPDGLLYDAWVLLANGAYWDPTEPKGVAAWNTARDTWRDRWHATLPEVPDAE